MADNGILVRAKFTARPGEQFLIRREAYRRIKLAFDQPASSSPIRPSRSTRPTEISDEDRRAAGKVALATAVGSATAR